ncbi:MAG: hypothetical protein V3R86_03045 [Candidatus Hydrothermarchaeaceae archaeon]
MDIIKRLFNKKQSAGDDTVDDTLLEATYIEEADDEYVLLKVFSKENPDVGFSYAINRIDELKVSVTELKRERNDLEKLSSTLQDDLEGALRFKDQIEDMKDGLLDKERELSDKSVEVDSLVRKSARLSVENEGLTAKVTKKDQQIRNYLKQIEVLRQDSRVIQLEKKSKLDENKLTSIEEDAKRLRIQNEENTGTLQIQHEELEQLRLMTASQEAELTTLKANWWEANQKVKNVNSTVAEKDSIISTKEETIRDLLVKSKKLALEMDVTNKNLGEKNRIIEDYKRSTEVLKEKEEALFELRQEHDRLKVELEEKSNRASISDSQLNELNEQLKTLMPLEGEVRDLRVTAEKQKDALNIATSEADQYKQMAASMDSELNSLKGNWWEVSKQVKVLKGEVELKDGIITAKDGTINGLTERLKGMTSELDSLKKQIAESAIMGTAVTVTPPSQEAAQPAEEPPVASSPVPEEAIEKPVQPVVEAPPAEEPKEDTSAPKVSSNDSKLKLLEIKKKAQDALRRGVGGPEPSQETAKPPEHKEEHSVASSPFPSTEEARVEPTPPVVEAPPAEEPKEDTSAPKVSPSGSKLKLLEIKRKGILKMLERPGVKDSPLGDKYQRQLVIVSHEIDKQSQE